MGIPKRLKQVDGIFGYYTTRKISYLTTKLAVKLGWSPNFLTVLSLIIAFGACVVLFLPQLNAILLIVGALSVQLAGVLDASDGEVARITGKGSDFGAWLDSFTDRIKEFAYFSAIGYYIMNSYGVSVNLIFLLTLLAIFGNWISGYITDTKKYMLREKRKKQITKGRFYLGMTDTRDFLLIVAFVLEIFTIKGFLYLLYFYGLVFMIPLIWQIFSSVKHIKKHSNE